MVKGAVSSLLERVMRCDDEGAGMGGRLGQNPMHASCFIHGHHLPLLTHLRTHTLRT